MPMIAARRARLIGLAGSAGLLLAAPASALTVITTLAELQAVNGNLAGSYRLGADIDASATKGWNAGAGFIPLGANGVNPTKITQFTGTFDGAGHVIKNLTIESGGTSQLTGLFAFIGTKGVVENLTLEAAKVGSSYQGILNGQYATGYLGALAGASYGTISHVTVSGTVKLQFGLQNEVAGLVAFNWGSIDASTSTVAVTGDAENSEPSLFLVGGLTAVNYATSKTVGRIADSASSGKVSSNVANGGDQGGGAVGGIAAANEGVIDGATVAGTLTCGGCFIGGAVGENLKGATIEKTASAATLSSSINANLGGLVGLNEAGATVTGSSASGRVTATGGNVLVGGLVGRNLGAISVSHATGAVLGVASRLSSADIGSFGGLVGYNDGGLVETSYATGPVTDNVEGPPGGLNLGGLVGDNVGSGSGRISQCYATGAVTGKGEGPNVGGLAGLNTYGQANGLIEDSYAIGTATGGVGSPVGALVGDNEEANLVRSYGTGKVTGGKGAFLGGAIGANRDGGTVSTVYFDATTGRGAGAGTGSETGMKRLADASLKSGRLPAGFSGTVWAAKAGFLPYLKWQAAP